MLGGRDADKVELECPVCGARVETTAKIAEAGTVRCPRGHEFSTLGILGGIESSIEQNQR